MKRSWASEGEQCNKILEFLLVWLFHLIVPSSEFEILIKPWTQFTELFHVSFIPSPWEPLILLLEQREPIESNMKIYCVAGFVKIMVEQVRIEEFSAHVLRLN